MVQYLGYGEKFDLPIPSQRFGTMPNPKWLKKKYNREWQGYDSANTSIGQGYVLVNPMQLAVMPARLASGKLLKPAC
ncbi:penicillin-binding transpeptidase domain-containing protein [Sphingomonas sediminicola]|uniref:penicillin-binding transpeptidase domain-containing protein n=1 Tax=Sphingomonas sediminicola TaxID=386874 RepID=UPI0024833DEE|nr:penicillin-binding transpeptidase domain-containing protein [Sphingomonas sediminicola]